MWCNYTRHRLPRRRGDRPLFGGLSDLVGYQYRVRLSSTVVIFVEVDHGENETSILKNRSNYKIPLPLGKTDPIIYSLYHLDEALIDCYARRIRKG